MTGVAPLMAVFGVGVVGACVDADADVGVTDGAVAFLFGVVTTGCICSCNCCLNSGLNESMTVHVNPSKF